MEINNYLFRYLFEGAKSTKQERVEDFITELISFMWEIDADFKGCLINLLKAKIEEDFDGAELTTQEVVFKKGMDKPFRYDIVIQLKTNKRVIIENKISSTNNQFIKYKNKKEENEIILLLAPKKYEEIKKINKEDIIFWEDLILFLKNNLLIKNGINKTLQQLRKSFFNYLFDYAGLYYGEPEGIPEEFKKLLDKYVKYKNQKYSFIENNSLFPFRFSEPYFGIEITDFLENKIELILEDKIIKKEYNKKEKIEILYSPKNKGFASVFDEEKDGTIWFNIGKEIKNNNIEDIKKRFKDFFTDFYEEQLSNEINKKLDKLIKLVKKLIEISGTENEFKQNLIRYYVYIKNKKQEDITGEIK